jgi:hypothetical protein
MTTTIGETPSGRSECWCCGLVRPPEQMVQLSNHPEVALCLRCAHFVHKQAWAIEDQARTGPVVRARDRFRRLRRNVVDRGWHHSRLLGRPLRWLGRHLP